MSKSLVNKKIEESKKPEDTCQKILEKIEDLTLSVDGKIKGLRTDVDGLGKRVAELEKHFPKEEKKASDEPEKETADEPEKTQEKKSGEAQSKAEGETKADLEPKTHKCVGANGVRKAFCYRDLKTGHSFFTSDRWAAKQAGNGEYDEVWAFYKDGQIDHILDPDEIREIFVK